MINLEIERALSSLLWSIAQHENSVECTRQSLSSSHAFEPTSVFAHFDRYGINSISSAAIRAFLERNYVPCTELETDMLIRQYDSDRDGQLSFTDLSFLILPSGNEELKNKATSRAPLPVVSLKVQHRLTTLLSKELKYQTAIEDLKQGLFSYNPNLWAAFRKIDPDYKRYATQQDIVNFLEKHGYTMDQNYVNCIFRRTDLDRDGVMSYSEFIETVLPSAAPKRSRPVSPVKTPPVRAPRHLCTRTPLKGCSSELLRFFHYQLALLTQLEAQKLELASKEDFSLSSTFRMFDAADKGYITACDLKSVLTSLYVPTNDHNITLLLCQYAPSQQIDFPTFKSMMLPMFPTDVPQQSRTRTLRVLQSLFCALISTEVAIESLRKSGSSCSPACCLHEAFNSLDIGGDGVLTIEELGVSLRVPFCESLQLLFSRYDKNGDHEVTYSEFLQEVLPKWSL